MTFSIPRVPCNHTTDLMCNILTKTLSARSLVDGPSLLGFKSLSIKYDYMTGMHSEAKYIDMHNFNGGGLVIQHITVIP